MSAQDCIDLIRQQAPDLTDDEIEELVTDLQQRLNVRRAEGAVASVEDALLDEADQMATDVAEAARIEKRNRLMNIVRRDNLLALARAADEATGDPSLGLEAAAVGVNAPFAGARQSADARGKALFGQYAGGLIADLRKEGLLATFNRVSKNKDLQSALARELRELTLPDGRPGISGVSSAQRMARIVHKYAQSNVARQNRAGAWIKRLPGFITTQTHDMARMRRASRRLGGPRTRDPQANYEAWRNFIRPLLGNETFDGIDDAESFLRSVYDALVTGKHLTAKAGDENDLRFVFKGPGNLAKRISGERKLHFKDADAWLSYNEMFGTRGLTESLIQDLESGARNTALMEVFGTNPRAMLDTVRDELTTAYRNDPRKFDRLSRNTLDWYMSEIDGSAYVPESPTLAMIAAAIRALQSLAKLGGAVLSGLSDIGLNAAEVRSQGASVLGAYGQVLSNFLDGLPTDVNKRETADRIGVALDGLIGNVATRFSAQDHLSGKMAKTMQFFFKVNLLGPWTDAHKAGLGQMMARDLAAEASKGWDALPGRLRDQLSAYGLDAEGWQIARQAVTKGADGRNYLMPGEIAKLRPEGVSARQRRKLLDQTETAIRSYIADRLDFATPTPGARERALMNMGTQAGTPSGEAVRFLMQFKSFPTTILTRPLGREIYGRGARSLYDSILKGEGDIAGLVSMMIGTTVLGYLAMAAKDIAKGRTPRDPADPATWQAAVLQGGGLGIYGDFLLGETNRFGRDALDTLAGPTFGTIADLDELRAKMMAGDDLGGSALNLAKSNTPFLNLFYTRKAVDHLFMYQLQEMVNPGYLRRMERRIQREQNQRFILPPSSTIPRGGGNRIFEGVR